MIGGDWFGRETQWFSIFCLYKLLNATRQSLSHWPYQIFGHWQLHSLGFRCLDFINVLLFRFDFWFKIFSLLERVVDGVLKFTNIPFSGFRPSNHCLFSIRCDHRFFNLCLHFISYRSYWYRLNSRQCVCLSGHSILRLFAQKFINHINIIQTQ